MRQIVTRIDDDLHTRLKERAETEGRSMNALVTEAVREAVGAPVDPWAAIKRRAKEHGIEFVETDAPWVSREELLRRIKETKGWGTASEFLLEERERGRQVT